MTVNSATADGTATAPADYTRHERHAHLRPRRDLRRRSPSPVIGDTLDEADETFFVNLIEPVANATIADGQGVGTIVDDDRYDRRDLDQRRHRDRGQHRHRRRHASPSPSRPHQPAPVTVDFATADGTATAPADYTATNGHA